MVGFIDIAGKGRQCLQSVSSPTNCGYQVTIERDVLSIHLYAQPSHRTDTGVVIALQEILFGLIKTKENLIISLVLFKF